MFARIASFEGGDIDKLRERNEEARASGTLNLPEGITSGMLLNDPASNRHLFVTFFDSREALDAAEARFASMGDEIPVEVRGQRTSLDVYEVAWEAST